SLSILGSCDGDGTLDFLMIENGASSSSSVGQSPNDAITLPASPSAVETAPRPSLAGPSPSGEASAPSEPLPPAPSRVPVLNSLLLILLLSLGFFLASFTAQNTDLMLHLATGRALLEGKYQFGVDPFAYTTEGIYWANTSWLFDLLTYAILEAGG